MWSVYNYNNNNNNYAYYYYYYYYYYYCYNDYKRRNVKCVKMPIVLYGKPSEIY